MGRRISQLEAEMRLSESDLKSTNLRPSQSNEHLSENEMSIRRECQEEEATSLLASFASTGQESIPDGEAEKRFLNYAYRIIFRSSHILVFLVGVPQ